MPNYVANLVILGGSEKDVNKALSFVKSKESLFDFNKIIKRPKALEISSSSLGEIGRGYLEHNKLNTERYNELPAESKREALSLGKKYISNIQKYGYQDWYDWSCNNWGTKWPAMNVQIDGCEITFDTAWSAPLPVLEALSKRFKNITLHFIYADEDAGYNTGIGSFANGEVEMVNPEGGSDEAMELYFRTHEYDRENYRKDKKGHWTWNEN